MLGARCSLELNVENVSFFETLASKFGPRLGRFDHCRPNSKLTRIG